LRHIWLRDEEVTPQEDEGIFKEKPLPNPLLAGEGTSIFGSFTLEITFARGLLIRNFMRKYKNYSLNVSHASNWRFL